MMTITKVLFLTFSLLAVCIPAQSQERVVWDKKPIEIILKPNLEKMVVLPTDSARAKIPAAISGSLETLSNNGVIYWRSSEEFTSKRILVQDTKTRKTLVINLSSSEKQGTDTPVTVLYKKESEQKETVSNGSDTAQSTAYGYETLTRVAAKHLYAPSRLVEVPANMHRVNVKQVTDSHLVRGHIVEMTPVISFSNAGMYVTAVKLKNKQRSKVILDPRNIRGNWLAATFQHATLGPAGELSDTTAVYLISKRPFWESF